MIFTCRKLYDSNDNNPSVAIKNTNPSLYLQSMEQHATS